MSYPHHFYVYADSSLETSVKGILNTYAVEYSPLPNPAQTDILKYRCNHRDTKEIEAIDVALERLGAWLVYGRIPEEMVEFEEAPSGEYTFTETLLYERLTSGTTDWIVGKPVTMPSECTVWGYRLEVDWIGYSDPPYAKVPKHEIYYEDDLIFYSSGNTILVMNYNAVMVMNQNVDKNGLIDAAKLEGVTVYDFRCDYSSLDLPRGLSNTFTITAEWSPYSPKISENLFRVWLITSSRTKTLFESQVTV